MARTYNNKETDVTMVPRNDRGEYVRVCRLIPFLIKVFKAATKYQIIDIHYRRGKTV